MNSLGSNQCMWPSSIPFYDRSYCKWSTKLVIKKHCSASSCGTSHAGHETTSDPCDERPIDLIQAACGLSSTWTAKTCAFVSVHKSNSNDTLYAICLTCLCRCHCCHCCIAQFPNARSSPGQGGSHSTSFGPAAQDAAVERHLESRRGECRAAALPSWVGRRCHWGVRVWEWVGAGQPIPSGLWIDQIW